MILTEYNMTTFKFQCLLTIHGILQSCAVVLHRGQTFSLEEALTLMTTNCPQTIPGFLLEINFQVGVSDTGLFLSFLSFGSRDRKGKVTRSQREVTQLPSFFSLADRWGQGLACLTTWEGAEKASEGRRGCPVEALSDSAAHRSGSPCPTPFYPTHSQK